MASDGSKIYSLLDEIKKEFPSLNLHYDCDISEQQQQLSAVIEDVKNKDAFWDKNRVITAEEKRYMELEELFMVISGKYTKLGLEIDSLKKQRDEVAKEYRRLDDELVKNKANSRMDPKITFAFIKNIPQELKKMPKINLSNHSLETFMDAKEMCNKYKLFQMTENKYKYTFYVLPYDCKIVNLFEKNSNLETQWDSLIATYIESSKYYVWCRHEDYIYAFVKN